MLSGEVNTTLGGRFLTEEVYPYSFKEYLQVLNVSFDEQSILSTVGKSEVVRRWNEYLHDIENERVYFYQDGCEVDFYIPEDETAIQVCYSLQD